MDSEIVSLRNYEIHQEQGNVAFQFRAPVFGIYHIMTPNLFYNSSLENNYYTNFSQPSIIFKLKDGSDLDI